MSNSTKFSPNASICCDCSVYDCEWLKSGAPVPGWTTAPTHIEYYKHKGGLQVLTCPKQVPFPARKAVSGLGPELPRRRYGKRVSVNY